MQNVAESRDQKEVRKKDDDATSSSFQRLDERIRSLALELGIESETQVQSEAVPVVLSGQNALIISPTGSGKTEAVLLPILEMILSDRAKKKRNGGIRAIYVTPLRALNRDMLRRMELWCSRLGISVEVRHGDTLQKDRRRQAVNPPEILITTPETLQVLLMGSRLRQGLKNLRWLVVDEIHQLASDRRGAQLSLALERLQEIVGKEERTTFQRIGLSATIANKEEVAQFLVGTGREVKIVDAGSTSKPVEYRIEMPEPTEEDRRLASELFASSHAVARMQRIADLVQGHTGTLIFVNSRTVAEFLAARLGTFNVKAGVHHGSLPREERERAEQEFKSGKVQTLVCTSTLELGIDIGSVDLVIQYMSPRQVNSLVQRVGRSGHSLARVSQGVTLTVSPEDALESIVISREAKEQRLEPVKIHECALDVLAHQVAGMLLEARMLSPERILEVCRRSYCYRNLSKDQLQSVIKYMQVLGYVRIESEDIIAPRFARCRNYYLENLSMIPDERRYNVIDVSTEQKVGILGEEFVVLHAKVGVHFIIKGKVWQIESIQGENVYVTPVVDPSASIPGWDGELLPIPESVATSVAKERGNIESRLAVGREKLLLEEETKSSWNADRNIRSLVIGELDLQRKNSEVPTHARIVAEKFGRYLIIHTSRGDRINLTLGELFEERLLRKGLVRHWWNDGYRIMIELTTDEFDASEIASSIFEFDAGTGGFLNAVIRKHFPFGYYMKFVAERFGALKRGLMLSGEALKDLTVKFRFTPVYEETLREALLLKVDVEGSLKLLEEIKRGEIKIRALESGNAPSPLGMYIFSRYAEMEEGQASYYGEDGTMNSRNTNLTESMRASISNEIVSLLCFNCQNLMEFVQVGGLSDPPKCPNCGSSLLGVIFYGARFAKSTLEKKMKREDATPLGPQESEMLTKARRSADLVLSYGKRGVIAQCVYGIGPQTAFKVLSRMHSSDDAFYSDLLEAKLNFIRTRQYWD